jgi:hypothetical protein
LDEDPDEGLLAFNGLNGATGGYLRAPASVADLSRLARGEKIDREHLDDLKARRAAEDPAARKHLGVAEGIDPKDLAQAGWGVIFPADPALYDPAIREALAPLLDLRREQATRRDARLYQEYVGDRGYQPDESKTAFLRRHGAAPGPVKPQNAPYYMLLVGGPDVIPYDFQYQLDVQYAVGRIAFDTPEDYARYADSVVRAERGEVALARRAAFFGVANPGDKATRMSATQLVAPLADWARQDQPDWTIDAIAPEAALKARLARLIGGDDTPALLFTASHGMGWPSGHPRQRAAQGALVCQDWPGPAWTEGLHPPFYFAGEDVASDARLHGLIAMHFACYGAGTPHTDDYAAPGADQAADQAADPGADSGADGPGIIAPRAFVASLPQRLLAHPRGGALAVIGHVDRAWSQSFRWKGAGAQLQTFQSTIKRLMEGYPVGAAMDYFNGRYAELSSDLTSAQQRVRLMGKAKGPTDEEWAGMWTAGNDARGYAVVGDPAVRLRVPAQDAPEAPPAAEAPIAVRPPEPAPPPPLTVQPPAPAAARDDPSQVRIDVVAEVSAASAAAPVPAADEDFGIVGDSLDFVRRGVAVSVQKAMDGLQKLVEGLTTTQVLTYVADDLATVKVAGDRFEGARLRAITRLSLNGDTLVCVPQKADGAVDDAVWKLHQESVDKALASRAETIKALAAAINVLNPLKP